MSNLGKLYEKVALVGVISPQLLDNSAATTAYASMGLGHAMQGTLLLGATDITNDFKAVQATSSTGAGSKDVASRAITQLGATDDDKQAIVHVLPEDLDLAGGFVYVAFTATVGNGTTGSYVAAVSERYQLRYGPAADEDLASVAEIVG